MANKNRQGKFIVFEGLDGSGKTTQSMMLIERLKDMGLPYLLTREPSDSSPVGRLTREAVSGGFSAKLENETMALLFAADRYQHICGEVKPALDKGIHVICDRYYYSNFAYQGDGETFSRLLQYNQMAMAGMKPDLTLFIDVPPAECLNRIAARQGGSAGLYENPQKLARVKARFEHIFSWLEKSDNIAVIDGCLSTAEVFARIWKECETVLNRAGEYRRFVLK